MQLIKMGDDMQNDGIERLLGMDKDLIQGNDLIRDANIELERQKQQLLQADENVKDIDSALNRAAKHIAFFSREFYSDNFTRCMILAILLIFSVIVIVVAFKKIL